jgi:hypothetical protein
VCKVRNLDVRPVFLESTDNTAAPSLQGCASGETVLHWQLTHTDTIMPTAAPPNPKQFLPDLKRIFINKKGFNMEREQRG